MVPVIASPFNEISEAKDAAKQQEIDLEIDVILIEPVRRDSQY
jgi:L,D-transpeptidase ErfK/SrfK